MESMPLLKPCRAQQSARFWVSVRRGLLIFFWMMFAALTSLAVVFLVRAYEPPPPSVWHQRRVICRNTAPAPQSDVARRIQAASALGCGGLILAQEEVNSLNLRRLVTEGKQYGVSIILEVPILEDYDCHQLQRLKDAARSWLADGASGFYLLGGGKATVIMISQILQNEVEIISGEERLILLPDWLCDDEDMPKNKSQVLRTCPLTDWNLQKFTVRSEMKDTAWEVMSGDTDGLQLRQFLAITLPGTIILSLNQSQPLPSWLSFLLILRFQTPDLYTGWLQIISDGSSYRALSHWGCSTLLVIIGCYDQSQNVSLRLPHFSASARLLLSTKQQRSPGQVLQDSVQLLPGEAQLLRLTPD
ncbi:hypothetical protein GDO78_017618 [Eleutherodactylus coqui]|uniref:Uncharacterized protein n=2 Tax=Eleutherodactylus coqui TaxID=57060 RepID=A0A8J6EB74_ELECQ|nr:hypothetical protein GDO78_017618 [Eleutherodactylus coqui]